MRKSIVFESARNGFFFAWYWEKSSSFLVMESSVIFQQHFANTLFLLLTAFIGSKNMFTIWLNGIFRGKIPIVIFYTKRKEVALMYWTVCKKQMRFWAMIFESVKSLFSMIIIHQVLERTCFFMKEGTKSCAFYFPSSNNVRCS